MGVIVNFIPFPGGAAGSVFIGNSIFVDSVNGNDGTGTRGVFTSPFLTLQAAANAALAGDVINIDPGTYAGALNLSATATNLTFQASGSRGKVNISGAITYSPSGAGAESHSFMYCDFNNTVTYNSTGKAGGGCILRFDGCRFISGAVSFTGRDNSLDNAQMIGCSFNGNNFTFNDTTANIFGALGNFGAISLGGSNNGGVLTGTAVPVNGTTSLTVSSISSAQISRWGTITTLSNVGTARIWETDIGTLTGTGTSITQIWNSSISTAASTTGTLELHDVTCTPTLTLTSTSSCTADDTLFKGNIVCNNNATLSTHDCDITGTTQIDNGTSLTARGSIFRGNSTYDGIVLSYSCDIQQTITVGATGFFNNHGGRINNLTSSATNGGRCLLLNRTYVLGTLTANGGGFINAIDADLQFIALAGAGIIDRESFFIDVVNSGSPTTDVVFPHPLSDVGYRAFAQEVSNLGGGDVRITNFLNTGFTLNDDIGGRDFSILVVRYQNPN